MRFEFREVVVVVQYEPHPILPQRLAQQQPMVDQDLNGNPWMSRHEVAVFQSPTGSTMAQVRADGATMQTRYFAEFVAEDAWDSRRDYANAKVQRLFDILDQGPVVWQSFGMVTVMRLSVRDPEQQAELRHRLQSRFGAFEVFTGGEPLFDFTFRTSHTPDAIRYASAQLSWYQERIFDLSVLPSGQGSEQVVRDWEMTVADEGLELRYDVNNKHGLHLGRRTWTRSDFTNILTSYFVDLQATVVRITRQLGGN